MNHQELIYEDRSKLRQLPEGGETWLCSSCVAATSQTVSAHHAWTPPAVVALHEAAEKRCGFRSVADVVHDMGPTGSDIADELSSWVSSIRDFSNSKILM
jgi:hypothetical protein